MLDRTGPLPAWTTLNAVEPMTITEEKRDAQTIRIWEFVKTNRGVTTGQVCKAVGKNDPEGVLTDLFHLLDCGMVEWRSRREWWPAE